MSCAEFLAPTRRNPGAPPRGRGAAPTQPTPHAHLARPRRPLRPEQTATHPAAPVTAGVSQNPAALARPPRRPPLGPTPTRPTADPAT
jgi:hypothetical protein